MSTYHALWRQVPCLEFIRQKWDCDLGLGPLSAQTRNNIVGSDLGQEVRRGRVTDSNETRLLQAPASGR